tara:strand:- start:372 stop:1046 length:675 start_codon:yes stop_codon:yes gene_type:complete
MAQIITPKNFDANMINYADVKKNSMGGNMVYLSYGEEKQRMTLQTPEMSAPFGVSTFTDDKTGAVKYSIDCSFRGMNDDPKLKLFSEKMQDFDKMMVNTAVKNSKEWFGKKMTKEVVEELYRPIVKPAKDPEKYAPTMKMKIRNIDTVEVYDHNKNAVTSEKLVKGSKLKSIIECSSIWFVNKSFGVSWNLVQVLMSIPDKVSGFSIKEDSDDDEEYEEVEVLE